MPDLPAFIDVSYMPEGRSEPDEDRFYRDGGEDALATIEDWIDEALDEIWSRGDEPIGVYSPTGEPLWTSWRW